MKSYLTAIASCLLMPNLSHAASVYLSENFDGLMMESSQLPAGWNNYNTSGGTPHIIGMGDNDTNAFVFTKAFNGGGLATLGIDLSGADLSSPLMLKFSFAAYGNNTSMGIGFGNGLDASGPESWVIGWGSPEALGVFGSNWSYVPNSSAVEVSIDIAPYAAATSGDHSEFRIFFIPRLNQQLFDEGDTNFDSFGSIYLDDVSVAAVPEPSASILVSACAAGFMLRRRRR